MAEPVRPPLIGLTGPIGCGKSTVGRMLSGLGGHVIDADELAREVTGPGEPALAAIRQRFGDAVFTANGRLDRTAMAALVFNDPYAMADLEAVVHPAVRQRIEIELAEAAAVGVPFVAIEAIKLVEGGLADRCDEVWLIDCSPSAQRRHLIARGTDPADAEQRIRSQGEGLSARLESALEGRTAHRRLSTDGSLARLHTDVEVALMAVLQATAE